MFKIMARFIDNHPDTIVDIVSSKEEAYEKLELYYNYVARSNNPEQYQLFYKEQI